MIPNTVPKGAGPLEVALSYRDPLAAEQVQISCVVDDPAAGTVTLPPEFTAGLPEDDFAQPSMRWGLSATEMLAPDEGLYTRAVSMLLRLDRYRGVAWRRITRSTQSGRRGGRREWIRRKLRPHAREPVMTAITRPSVRCFAIAALAIGCAEGHLEEPPFASASSAPASSGEAPDTVYHPDEEGPADQASAGPEIGAGSPGAATHGSGGTVADAGLPHGRLPSTTADEAFKGLGVVILSLMGLPPVWEPDPAGGMMLIVPRWCSPGLRSLLNDLALGRLRDGATLLARIDALALALALAPGRPLPPPRRPARAVPDPAKKP